MVTILRRKLYHTVYLLGFSVDMCIQLNVTGYQLEVQQSERFQTHRYLSNPAHIFRSEAPKPKIHYENTPVQIYRKFHRQNTESFQIKHSDIFHISAQNIECGYSLEPPRRGGSNEYPQSMFLSRNKK